MGIDTNDKIITLNHTHNRRVITDVEKLPNRFCTNGIVCYELFQRMKKIGNDSDGNPLLYSLKNIDGWMLDDNACSELDKISQIVMEKIIKKQIVDVIVYLPSSSSLPRRISIMYNKARGKALVNKSVIRKKTAQEAIIWIRKLVFIGKDKKAAHTRLLADLEKMPPNTEYQMKFASHHIRNHIDAFTVTANPDNLNGLHVLLIDDIVSSGSSLRCASEICMDLGANSVKGICFMGPTRDPIDK